MEEDREVFLEEGEEEEEKKLKKWREAEGQNWNCNRLLTVEFTDLTTITISNIHTNCFPTAP